jgi:methylase of polypeptide subunit release factors
VGLFRHTQEPEFPNTLKVLDLCTGTGCISLLFAHLFPLNKTRELHVLGVDISLNSIALARYNRTQIFRGTTDQTSWTNNLDGPNFYAGQRSTSPVINFIRADVLANSTARHNAGLVDLRSALHQQSQPYWDVLISNPPYISPKAFNSSTTRSVRNYEPKLALVPGVQGLELQDEEQGDLFYPRLLQIAEEVKAKIWLVEVADLAQAERVAAVAQSSGKWDGVEIWRDEPGLNSFGLQRSTVEGVKISGKGHGRSVLCWRGPANSWLGRDMTPV